MGGLLLRSLPAAHLPYSFFCAAQEWNVYYFSKLQALTGRVHQRTSLRTCISIAWMGWRLEVRRQKVFPFSRSDGIYATVAATGAPAICFRDKENKIQIAQEWNGGNNEVTLILFNTPSAALPAIYSIQYIVASVMIILLIRGNSFLRLKVEILNCNWTASAAAIDRCSPLKS